jgi:hypothetical protein
MRASPDNRKLLTPSHAGLVTRPLWTTRSLPAIGSSGGLETDEYFVLTARSEVCDCKAVEIVFNRAESQVLTREHLRVAAILSVYIRGSWAAS